MQQEIELLKGLLRDEPLAWQQFLTKYDRIIYRCIYRVVAQFKTVTGIEDIREIHSNVLLALVEQDKHKLRAFDPDRGSRLGSWVGIIATNTTYDFLRVVARQPYALPTRDCDVRARSTADPVEALEARDEIRHLAQKLKKLSARDRLFFTLYFVRELEAETIATILGISVGTVYTKKFKVRAALESA